LRTFFNHRLTITTMDYFSTSSLSLYLQFLILFGLLVGYLLIKQKKLIYHSYLMFTLYSIHVLSILIFMLSTAYNIYSNLLGTSLGYVTIVHSSLGIIVLLLSTYILWNWRFQKPGAICNKMKKKMKILAMLWVFEMLLGLLEYYLIYLK
jgi:hypothetical protein